MNCQHESENERNKQPASTEQQPMETLDYLRLASFIHYLKNDGMDGRNPGISSAGEPCLA